MLTLTPAANEAVEAIIAKMGPTENAGLRISGSTGSENDSAPQGDLELSVVPEPEPDDATIEGTPIYVDPSTAEFLEDKVLDAEVGEEQIRFSIYEQPSG
jgi:Fe-S cluster assembly iron-binding protein IscA